MSGVTVRGEFGDRHDDLVARAAGLWELPGETVRPLAKTSVVAPFAGRDLLVVKETVVADVGQGPEVLYSFHEVEGEYSAARFAPERKIDQRYGVVAKVGEDFWFVPLDDDKPGEGGVPRQAGEPKRIATELNRHSRYCLGFPNDAEVFAHIAAEPATGEIALVDMGEGFWQIDFVPWWTAADVKEVAICSAAVAEIEQTNVPGAAI